MLRSLWDDNTLVLLACSFLLQSDQNLLAPHLSTVAREFGMNDIQRDEKLGGELAMGLFLLGAPAALAIGAMADRYPRKLLLVLILLVGGAASLGTALARSYSDLFWMRALTGVSLGSALPVTFSLVGDMFAPSQRTAASGRVGVAMSAGVGFGQAMSGFLGAALDSWRAPFVVVGVLFVALAAVVWMAFVEPRRGAFDDAGSDEDEPRAETAQRDLAAVFRTPTALLVFLQGIPGCVPWGVIIVYLQDYLQADLGLSLARSAMVLTCFAIGGFGGQFIGGELGQRLYTWRKPAAAWHMSIAELLSVPPLVVMLTTSKADANFAKLAPVAVVLGLLATQTGPIVRACLTNTTAPRARASAFAVFALFDDLGKGFGPVVIARMVKAYGRKTAFTYAAVFGWGVGSLVNASITLTLEADERRLRSTNEFELVPTETLGGAGYLHRRSPSHSPEADAGLIYLDAT
jgi:predicted MFS family arabinose efflux permease